MVSSVQMPAVGTTRGDTLSVKSRQGKNLSASAGHASTHLGFPSQRKHLVALPAPASKDIIPHGQARWHILQPTHRSTSTTLTLRGGLATIASLGQALGTGTGCGHWWHTSGIPSPLPQWPCPCCP